MKMYGTVCAVVAVLLCSAVPQAVRAEDASGGERNGRAVSAATPLSRAKIFLAAGDYRRALEACQQEVSERPSAASYTYLTYIYHALDGYLDHAAGAEQWGAVEALYWNLAYRDAMDLVDPPGGLARMAKEMIQGSVRYQADVHAAMAARLDKAESDRLWVQQTAWRKAEPDRWWAGVPREWNW
ncbi:MAG: hypothetical protein U0172_10590 [Nitrospiraceae bacterium]